MSRKALKILIAHTAYRQRGGEDLAVQAEIELLRSKGHEVILMLRDNENIERSNLRLLADTLWSRSSAADLRVLIAFHSPDLVHVHNTFPLLSPSIYWAAASAKIPLVQTIHNFRLLCAQAMFLRQGRICEDCLGKLPWRGVLRKCYRNSVAHSAAIVSMLALHRALGSYRTKVTRYIALSDFSRRRLIEGGLPAERIRVKPNFVDVSPSADQPRSGALFVGRLSEEKGLNLLMDALIANPKVHCEIVGDGPLRPMLANRQQISARGWEGQEQVYERMRKAAFLVLPSIGYEQFPRVLAEAFACSLPIIAPRQGSLKELVAHGQTGLLFEPGSAQDLAEKVKFAYEHAATLRAMGENARREYENKYSPQKNYEQLMSIYSETLSSAPAGA
ncbi:MAG TPA: glycosyltransferase family 4 protein [Burkholderiales bacterium]|nr:glycosyltransferase family 4 protein [Burkholderiales bacterium]